MKGIKALVVLIGLLSTFSCTTLSVEELAENHRQKGVSYMDKSNYELAMIEINKAIELNPNFARAYYNRGMCYYYTNRHELALTDYRRSLELDPNFVRADYANANIAMILFNRNDFANAAIYVEKALAINPNNGTALSIKKQIEENASGTGNTGNPPANTAKNQLQNEIDTQFSQINKAQYEYKKEGTSLDNLLGIGATFQTGKKYKVLVLTGMNSQQGSIFTDSVTAYIDAQRKIPSQLSNYYEKYYIYFTTTQTTKNDVYINLEYIEL